jgi:hypothetical protein
MKQYRVKISETSTSSKTLDGVKINRGWETEYTNFDQKLKAAIFWDMTPSGSCKNRHFGRTYRLHIHGEKLLSPL